MSVKSDHANFLTPNPKPTYLSKRVRDQTLAQLSQIIDTRNHIMKRHMLSGIQQDSSDYESQSVGTSSISNRSTSDLNRLF